jgi:hypothetical protein
MAIEKEQFEPYLSGYLGNSLEEAQQLQSKLQEFEPTAQVDFKSHGLVAMVTIRKQNLHNSNI